MNLLEAVKSGKKIRRISLTEEFLSFDDLQDELGVLESADLLAEDWEVETVVAAAITDTLVATAWNAARGTAMNIKPAGSSDFYKRFVVELKRASGVR